MEEYSFEDLVGSKPKKEEGFSFEELSSATSATSAPATSASLDLNSLVANSPFPVDNTPPIPPLIARPEYVNRWPETSYLRTPESGYTTGLADGQEVILSTDGKSQKIAKWNAKANAFQLDYEEKVPGITPTVSGMGGSMPYYVPPTTVTKTLNISPEEVIGYTNAADKIDTAKVALGRSIAPTAAGFAGFAGGSALTAGALALAPETLGASLIPLLGGALAGFGTSTAASAIQDKVWPIDKEQQLALDSNPTTAGVMSFIPAFAASPASPRTYLNLASKTPGVAAQAATQLGSNAVMMGALGTGNDVGGNLVAGRGAFDNVGLGSVLHHAGTGLLLGHPNKLGRVMEAPGRIAANATLKPFGRGEYAPAPANTTANDIATAAGEVEAQAQAQPDAAPAPQAEATAPAPNPAPAARPEGSVPPRPRYDERFEGRGRDGIDEYTKAWKDWDAQYGQTHWSDGTPKKPLPTPAPQAEAPAPVAEPAPAPAPQGEAPKPAPAEAPKPTGNVFELGVADLSERIRFIKGELGRRQGEADADAKAGRSNPESAPRIERLKKSLAEAEGALERLKDRNAPRSELPPPVKEPSTAEVLAQRKAEFDKITRQLEAAHRSQRSMKGGDEQVALLEAEHEAASTAYEEALTAHEKAQQQGGSQPPPPAAPAPKPVAPKPVTPVAPPAPTAEAPAPATKPAAPAAKPKKEPSGVTQAREQLAKLEASGNADSNQARARRKYIRKWEKDNGLPYSVELEAPKPPKAPKPAPTEEPVAKTPVEPVAVEPAPAPAAEAPKPGRRSIVKPDGTTVYEPGNAPKSWGKKTHAIVDEKGNVSWLTKEDTGKLVSEYNGYDGKFTIHDLATGEKVEAGKGVKSEAPKETAPAEDFDPAEQPNPKEDPKDVAERERNWQQENPADTREPTAKEVEIQTTKNIIGGLEKQIAAKEAASKGNTAQAKKQRATLEAAKKKLAELEGKTEEPVAQAEPAPAEAPTAEAPKATEPVAEQPKPIDYEQRLSERLNRINRASPEEAQAILKEEYADPERHFDGTRKVETAVRNAAEARKSAANRNEDDAQNASKFNRGEHAVDNGLTELYAKQGKGGAYEIDKARKAFNEALEAAKAQHPDRVYSIDKVESVTDFGVVSREVVRYRKNIPETPAKTVEDVQRIAGVKLSKGAREELAIRSEEGLQPDFIDEGNIQSLKDHLKDLVERLETTIDASRNDPYEGPKARKQATEAKKAVEAAIAKLESEVAQAPKATEPTPAAEAPKADTTSAERQVEAINDKLAELERTKQGESPEAEALRAQRDKLQATIDAQKPDSPDVRSAAEKWADETIRESKKRLNSGLDPEVLAAYAVKGAIKFGRSLKDFKEFSREMVKEFGDGIKPHLKAIFDKAQEPGLAKEYAEQAQARSAAGKPEPDLKGEAAKMAELRAEQREQGKELAQGQRPTLSAGGRTWRSVVDHPIVAFFKPLSMRMRTIADLNPQSETAQKVVNDFSLIPGTKETGPDFNTEAANQRNIFYNKFSQALGPVLNDFRRMTKEQKAKFNDIFIKAVEGRLPVELKGETGEAVKRVREVMKELHKYGIDAGLEMGEVTNYFPRMVSAEAVIADRAGFEEAAARAYERQWERLQKEGLQTKSIDPQTKKPIITQQDEFGFADGQTERPNFKEMARKWADAIELGQEGLDFERGIFDDGNAATKENFQKKREFTKEEAAEFDAFRDKDFESIVSQHVGGMVRRAEIARRLGADGMKWGEVASKMNKEGVSAEHINELKTAIQSNLGVTESRLTGKAAGAQDIYNLVSTSAFLKLTGLLNLAEPASIGMREGDPVQAATSMFTNAARVRNVLTRLSPAESKAVKTEIERIYGKGHDLASALAIELGINQIDHGLGSISSGYHLDGGSDVNGNIRRMNDNVYRMYGIHATEVAKRETSLTHGMQFIEKSVQFLEGNSNLQRIFKAIGKDVKADTLAKDRIMELGVKEADVPAFSEFAKSLRGLDADGQLKRIMSDEPMAAEYRKALTIFNKQSSVQATRASRTQIANDHPLGRLLFQFATFTNEWSSQHGRYMVETAKKVRNSEGRYNGTERLLAAGAAPAYAVAVAGMYGIRMLSNYLTGFEFDDKNAPAWVKSTADAIVYTGILGPAEQLYKAVIREQLPAGLLGSWLQKGLETYGRLKENPESDAAQKAGAKIGYRSAGVPAVNTGLAAVSSAADAIPNPIVRGGVKLGAAAGGQFFANNRVEDAVAGEVAGTDNTKGATKNPRPPAPPRPPQPR